MFLGPMAICSTSTTVRSFTCSWPHSWGAKRARLAVRYSSSAFRILTHLQERCATPLPVLRRVADAMTDEMRLGLDADGGSQLMMFPTYVDSLPTGDDNGLFYALDLGGTNFRVLRVQLGGKGDRIIDIDCEQVEIPEELMSGTSEQLFDFIALELAKFAKKENERFDLPCERKREIGFAFSFPVKHTSINSGILIKWTKGFSVSGLAGKDVVTCLNEAMKRQGLDMQVAALVNDAVGTLAGAHYWDEDVMVAVILGTGTNACYVEQIEAIPKLQGVRYSSGRMIISTEWGAFSRGLPLTEFDHEVDATSINPGEQIFEKAISGMYLGEIVRRVLLMMAEDTALFGDSVPEKLSKPFALRTPDLCAMQQDSTTDLQVVNMILSNVVGAKCSSLSVRKVVVEVCDIVVKRGGRLAGAGIVGILQKLNQDSKGLIYKKRTAVAIDGSLYEHYPQYRKCLQDSVSELLGSDISRNVIIKHSKDGSSIGAALLAAAHSGHMKEL